MPERQGLIPLRDRVRELDRIYGIVEREMAREMASMDIGNYRELRAIRTQEKIDGLVKMLNRAAIKWSKKAVPEAYKKGYAVSRTRLEILGAQKDEEFNNKTHTQAVEYETDETINVLIKANQSIKMNVATFIYLARTAARGLLQFQAFDMRDEQVIDELLGDALRAGETRAYAAKAVREHFAERFGDAKFITINGRDYNLRKYADLVAKTRLRVVQSEAVKNSCKEYENDLIQISAHGTDCRSLICQEYEGNVYSISGRHPIYPMLPAWPPYHPRCQHHALPTSEVALAVREVYREKPYEIEATGPRQVKVASLDEALKELPRRHVMRVEKYYIDTPGKMVVDVPHFKGQAAGYWRYSDKSIHLSSKFATNKQVIFHEVGHAAYETGIVPYTQKPLWKAWHKKATNLQIKYPSQYALTNEAEFFAECYSHYFLKNYNLIDDGIKKWFDKTFVGGL